MTQPHITLPEGELPSHYVDVNTVIGPFFLAQCFNWTLFGILCLQVYIYTLRFSKDLTYIKTLVYTVFALDLFFMAAITHAGWAVLVANWGDVNILHLLPWTWAMVPVNSGVVSCIVQLFFAYRIWKLSKSWKMPTLIALITITQCVFAIITGTIAAHVRTFHYIRDFLPGVWLVGSITADVLISATLVHILWGSQTGFKDTDGVVMRLIRLTIEAAAVPSICAAVKLALIYSYHDNRHLIFCVVLGRLYSNTLLAMLNCRDAMFGGGSAPNTLAGAARLSEPHTVMSLLKSKLSFGKTSTPGSQSRGSISYASREQFASLDRAYGAEDGKARPGDRRPSMSLGLGRAPKYTPSAGPEGRQPQSPSYLSGNHHVQFPRRGSADRESTYSMTEFDGRSRFGQQSKIDEEIPVSPTTAEMKTTSELLPGAKGWSADDLQSEDVASPFVVTPPAPTATRNL